MAHRCAGGLMKKLDIRSGSHAIDISWGSLTWPSKHRHGTTLLIRWFRHTAPLSRLLRLCWGYGGHILDLTPGPSRGMWVHKSKKIRSRCNKFKTRVYLKCLFRNSHSKNKYSEDDIIKMLEFLVDNIFVVFSGKVFQQIVGIPMETNCAPLLADIFLYSYEAEFIQCLLSTGRKKLAYRFNFTYRYIDDVLSINNPEFENFLGQMYPVELEIKETTESNTSASYLDLLLSIGKDGQLHTSIFDIREKFPHHKCSVPE